MKLTKTRAAVTVYDAANLKERWTKVSNLEDGRAMEAEENGLLLAIGRAYSEDKGRNPFNMPTADDLAVIRRLLELEDQAVDAGRRF